MTAHIASRRRRTPRRSRKPALESLELRSLLATIAWIGQTDGLWTDPNNWTDGGTPPLHYMPGPLDDVVLNGGHTVTIPTGTTVDRMAGLSGNGKVLNQGTLAFPTPVSGHKGGVATAIINQGLIAQQASFFLDVAGSIQNTSAGTFDIQGDFNIDWTSAITFGTIQNNGLFEKSSGTNEGTAYLNAIFTNTATIRVNSGAGILQFGRGLRVNNGTLDVADGTEVVVTHDFQTGEQFQALNTVTGKGGGTVQIEDLNSNAGPATLNFAAGMLEVVGGGAWFLGNTLTNTGDMVIVGSPLFLGSFANQGTMHIITKGNLRLHDGAAFDNAAQGTIDLADVGSISASVAVLTSEGNITKATGSDQATINAPVLSTGTLQVKSGTLAFSNKLTVSGGTINTSSGSTLSSVYPGEMDLAGTVTGTGSGTVRFDTNVRTNTSPATVNFPTGMLVVNSGTFYLTSILTNVGDMTIVGAPFFLGVFSNQGTIEIQTGANLRIHDAASFDNAAQGTIELADGSSLSSGAAGLTNAGIVSKSTGTGQADINGPMLSSGTMRVKSGVLTSHNVLTVSGGTIDTATKATLISTYPGDIHLAGTITGLGAGTLLISGGNLRVDAGKPAILQFSTGVLAIGATILLQDSLTLPTNTQIVDNTSYFWGGALINAGTMTIAPGRSFNIGNAESNLDNPIGSTISLGDGSALNGGGILTNEGTLTKATGSGQATLGQALTNTGIVRVQSGTLNLNGTFYLQGGSIDTAAGTTLFTNGDFYPTGTPTGVGAGTFAVRSTIRIDGGNQANLQFANGTFTIGPCTFFLAGQLTLTGNTQIVDNITYWWGGPFTNVGTMTIAPGKTFFNGNGGTFDNPVGSTISLSDGSAITGAGRLTNEGTLSTAAGTNQATVAEALQNTGVIRVQSGTLNLNGTFYLQGGSIDTAAGTTLVCNADFDPSGTASGVGAGTFAVRSTIAIDGGNVGNLQFPTGTFTIGPSVMYLAGELICAGNTQLVDGIMYWWGGGFVNAGTMTIAPGKIFTNGNGGWLENTAGSTWNFGDGSVLNGDGTLLNEGTIVKSSGSGEASITTKVDSSGTVEARVGTLHLTNSINQVNGSTLTGGTWKVDPGATLDLALAPPLTGNAASVRIEGPGASFPQIAGLNSNSGTLSLLGGQSFTTGSDLSSSGAIILGPLSTLNVGGAFTQTNTGTLTSQIGGAPASHNFGQLAATGTATLAGTLTLSLVNAYTPTVGQVYTLVTDSNQSGAFTTIATPSIDPLRFLVETTTTSVTATVGLLNHAPKIDPIANPVIINEGTSWSMTPKVTHVDQGQTLTYDIIGAKPAWLSLDKNTGLITCRPAVPATATVTLSVTDNGTPPLSDTSTFTISAMDVAPVLNLPASLTVAPPKKLQLLAKCTFTDPGAETWQVWVNYGDSVVWQSLGAASTSHSFTLNHLYKTYAPYKVQLKVVQTGGGVAPVTVIGNLMVNPPAQVTKVAPVIKVGTGLTAVDLTFSQAMNAARANNRSNYVLVSAGKDGKLGTKDDTVLSIANASYNASTKRVRLTFAKPQATTVHLKLTVRASNKATNLVDTRGWLLDGNGDGKVGGDFTWSD